MKKALVFSASLALLVSNLGFANTLHPLSKDQAMKAFEDKTITTVPMVTLHGKLLDNNPITVFFSKDKQMTGKYANKPENEPQDDKGSWNVKANGVLCVTWQHWETAPICVYAYKLADSIIFVNADTNKFESMVMDDHIQVGNKM